MKKIWTRQETEILKANYIKYNQRQLHNKFLPSKSVIQINNKKMDMGLKKPVWTNNERALLLEHGANYTHRELVAKFFPGKTLSQVNCMRKYLGIRRSVIR